MAEKLSYWERRHLKDKAASVNRAEDYLLKEQQKLYSQASREIQKEIEKLYQRFADQQHITLAEAKRQVSGADFRKIDWQGMIDESKDYLSKLPEAGELPGDVVAMMEKLHQDLEAQMALYSRRGRISYLELRKLEIDRILLGLYDRQQADIYSYLKSEFDDGYYRGIFNTQQRVGFGRDFVHPNERAVEKAILARHDKRNYSKALYAHCKNFGDDLQQEMTVGLIRGEGLDRMASRIRKRMDVSSSAAKRLVRTETAYIFEEAAREAYGASGIEWYEYLASLDSRTSEACRELDGKHFKVKDAVPGKNYPPMHPNCRSTTVCWFPDEEGKKAATTRAAKEGSGRYYEVPAGMTYKEWRGSLQGRMGEERQEPRGLQLINIKKETMGDKALRILQDAYERRRVADSLHTTPLGEMADETKARVFNVDIGIHDGEVQRNIADQLGCLARKYKTTCYGVTTVSRQEAAMNSKKLGWNVFEQGLYKSQIYLPPLKKERLVERIRTSIEKKHSVAVNEEDYLKYVITHEFGHTILNMGAGAKNWLHMDEGTIKKAQKEIREIYGEYKEAMLSLYKKRDNLKERINSPDISTQWQAFQEIARLDKEIGENFISNYAGGYIRVEKDGKYHIVERDDPDEFLAEAFAMHELGIKKSPYAERVAGVLGRYFGW